MTNYELENGKHTAAQKMLFVFLIILFLVSATSAGFYFWKFKQAQQQLVMLASPEGQKEVAQKDTAELLAKISKIILLPTDEEPVVATITDKEALAKEQPFYENASNGDRVVAYLKAKKAIIYSMDKNIIINAGPIYTNENNDTASRQETNNNEQQKPAETKEPQTIEQPIITATSSNTQATTTEQ